MDKKMMLALGLVAAVGGGYYWWWTVQKKKQAGFSMQEPSWQDATGSPIATLLKPVGSPAQMAAMKSRLSKGGKLSLAPNLLKFRA